MGELNMRNSASELEEGNHTKESYDESEDETLERMAREKYAERNDSSGSESDVSSEDETNKNKYYDSASNWKYGGWLMTKSLEELKEMKSADSLYMKLIKENIQEIGERMKCMKLGERNVEIAEYPKKEDANLLHDVLNKYDPSYDESIRETKKQWMIKRFDKFVNCPKHCKVSDYLLEYKLCGEEGCDLCPRMPRVLQMKNKELTREVLGFVPLPRIDGDGGTFLPFDECQRLMDNGATLKDELRGLKRVRDNFKEHDDQHAERKKMEHKEHIYYKLDQGENDPEMQ